jgi:hypothetical protein
LLPGYIVLFGIKGIKNGRANKDGEKQGYEIHSDAEKEWLVPADCGKGGFTFHGY